MSNIPHHAGLRGAFTFINVTTGDHCQSFWPVLTAETRLNATRPELYERLAIGSGHRTTAAAHFFPDHCVLYPGWQWNPTTCAPHPTIFSPFGKAGNTRDFFLAAEAFFDTLGAKKIAVQVSGGLDSSLIIGLLKLFKVPHLLIGMASARYEFRTERVIQEYLASSCSDACLLDYEAHLPFSGLAAVPAHQCPDLASINYSSSKAMACACESRGVDVLISGAGGDMILGNAMRSTLPIPCHPHFFNDAWLQETVFTPSGVTCISFFSDPNIAGSLCRLRQGYSADISKLWARNVFSDLLPFHLVDSVYKADFWGHYVDGLQQALPFVLAANERAYEITRKRHFSPDRLRTLVNADLFSSNMSLYQTIEARLSVALWYSSFRETESTNNSTLEK